MPKNYEVGIHISGKVHGAWGDQDPIREVVSHAIHDLKHIIENPHALSVGGPDYDLQIIVTEVPDETEDEAAG